VNTNIETLLLAIVGSSAFSAVITYWLGRPKMKVDNAQALLNSALELESRTSDRYKDVSDALEMCQLALDEAHKMLEIERLYTKALEVLLSDNHIPLPIRPSVPKE